MGFRIENKRVYWSKNVRRGASRMRRGVFKSRDPLFDSLGIKHIK